MMSTPILFMLASGSIFLGGIVGMAVGAGLASLYFAVTERG